MGERSEVRHHPPEELLVEYAAGTSSEAHALFVACHLTYCPQCRAEVAQLEALGGALLGASQSDAEPLVVTDLDRRPAYEGGQPMPASDPLLPMPLLPYVGPSSQLPWRRVLPGVATVELPLAIGASPVRLIRANPGRGVPMHTHSGQELDLVLQGGLRDHVRNAQYEPGDVQSADESVSHRLSVLPGEPCILLSVNEQSVKPMGLWSKLVYGVLPW